MKKLLIILISVLIGVMAQAQTNANMEDLIANSKETPDLQLKAKMPLFYSVYEDAKNNDGLIKQFFFIEKKTNKGFAIVMSGNVIFINQDSLLNATDKNTESKAIVSLFYSIGFIHAYKSGNFPGGRDTGMLTRRELYITKFSFNKALELKDNVDVLKVLTNKIKTNGFSTIKYVNETAKSISELPLYQQVLNYTKTNLASDKPKEFFDITLKPIEPIKKQEITQSQPPTQQVAQPIVQPIARPAGVRHSGIFMRKGKENPDMAKVNKLLKDFDVTESFTTKSSSYRNKYIGESFTASTLFLEIHKIANSYLLQVHIIYKEAGASFINSYSLHADNSVYPITNIGENAIRTNGTSFSVFVASLKDEEEVKFFELFAKARNADVYYNGALNTVKNTLSGREQKRIQATLDLFNELTQ